MCKKKCDALESSVRALIRNIGLPYDFEKHDIGYTIFFQIAGKWYVRIDLSADECDDDKLHELEKFIKATDTLCRRYENWDIKMRSEEENEEDYIFDDSYNWHEPEK